MIIVKMIQCNEGEELIDLTIGNLYQGWFSEDDSTFVVDKDDAGEQNELYFGEYEVVTDAE